MSTISAGTTTTTALVSEGDTTGNLDLQSSGTTGLRIGANGKAIYPSTALTTAVAGTLEYDGKVPYFTPQGTQRGLMPGMQYYRLDSTLAMASSASAQSILGVGVTLSSSTVYQFVAYYAMIKTTTTQSHTWGIGFGGTATLNNIAYKYSRYFDTAGFNTLTSNLFGGFVTTASNTTMIGASASATNYQWIELMGVVSINAGGTFIPQITISTTGPIYTLQGGSYFAIYPVGASGANTSVGTWA